MIELPSGISDIKFGQNYSNIVYSLYLAQLNSAVASVEFFSFSIYVFTSYGFYNPNLGNSTSFATHNHQQQ